MNQLPQKWKQVVPSHCDEHIQETIHKLVEYANDGDLLIEIGAFTGAQTVAFTECIKKQGKDILLLSIDPHLGEGMSNVELKNYSKDGTYDIWLQNVEKYGHPEFVINSRLTQVDCFKKRKKTILSINRPIAGVFIDGLHTYDTVINELYSYGQLLKKNGILCGHDYFALFLDQVVRAVDDYCEWNSQKVERISQRHIEFGHGEPFCFWIQLK